MIADANFLRLDSTAWTAIAAIIAVVFGTWGIVGPYLSARLRRPVLELSFEKIFLHSERIKDVWHLRVPVGNRLGRNSATNVEIFLEAVSQPESTDSTANCTYLPIRLVWTHESAPVCDRIAGGAYRLLDLGAIDFTINEESGFPERVMAQLEPINPLELHFKTETYGINPLKLSAGQWKVVFLIAADNIVRKQTVVLELACENYQISDYLKTHLKVVRWD